MEEALIALKSFDWGGNRGALEPIVKAIQEAGTDPQALGVIETALLDALAGETPRPGKEFVCRQLAYMGSDRALPALEALLMAEETADMARYALERIPGDAATAVLRAALSKTKDTQRLGIVDSLEQRRDQA